MTTVPNNGHPKASSTLPIRSTPTVPKPYPQPSPRPSTTTPTGRSNALGRSSPRRSAKSFQRLSEKTVRGTIRGIVREDARRRRSQASCTIIALTIALLGALPTGMDFGESIMKNITTCKRCGASVEVAYHGLSFAIGNLISVHINCPEYSSRTKTGQATDFACRNLADQILKEKPRP